MNGVAEVFLGFLRLGFTGFGGPLALAAQMQRDFVEKRAWITEDEFRRAFALIKSMPGAVAFNTAVYLGRRRAGYGGGLAAGVALLAPSFVFIVAFAASYATLKASPLTNGVLDGMQASALALIIAAVRPIAGPNIRQPTFWILAALGGALFATGVIPEPLLIVGGGVFWFLWRRRPSVGAPIALAAADPTILRELFWICFKAGAFVFGSGIAIAPLLERDFVERLAWATHDEFMDALAIGQVTPGPVLLTTAFLGHKVAGLPGAFTATIGVYLAGFLHMMTWFPAALGWLSRQRWLPDFLFGALAMVIGTIVVTVVILAIPWTERPFLYAITALGLFLALRTRTPSWAVVLVGGIAGMFWAWIGG